MFEQIRVRLNKTSLNVISGFPTFFSHMAKSALSSLSAGCHPYFMITLGRKAILPPFESATNETIIMLHFMTQRNWIQMFLVKRTINEISDVSFNEHLFYILCRPANRQNAGCNATSTGSSEALDSGQKSQVFKHLQNKELSVYLGYNVMLLTKFSSAIRFIK